MSMDLGLEGRTALVCASSRGLGYACARSLAAAGATVVLNGRNVVMLDYAADRLCREGADVEVAPADLTTVAGRELLLSAWPSPDILITNIWALQSDKGGEFHSRRTPEAGFAATTEIIRTVAPAMAARGFGRIVNIASMLGESAAQSLVPPGDILNELIAFSAPIARRYARSNVTINSVEPGFFATGSGTRGHSSSLDDSVPAARLGHPAEFGNFCAFLCSAEAGYITGQKLVIDGGLSAGAGYDPVESLWSMRHLQGVSARHIPDSASPPSWTVLG